MPYRNVLACISLLTLRLLAAATLATARATGPQTTAFVGPGVGPAGSGRVSRAFARDSEPTPIRRGERPAGLASSAPVTEGEATAAPSKTRRAKTKTRITSLGDMDSLLEGGTSMLTMDVRGDSYEELTGRTDLHPVIEVLKARKSSGSKPGERKDDFKVGLAIEGGGMRGCVSAGMIASIVSLGLMDCFDGVYGSSAGSLVGTYAIAGQQGMPRLGCSVYYDTLTGSGRHFIDTRYLLRALGLGLVGTLFTRVDGLKELVLEKYGSPVLKLEYLLGDVVENLRPLDWDLFWKKQAKQPLHVIASGVNSGRSVSLTSRGGHFSSLRELTSCIRASMLLPGITGPMMKLPNVEEPLVDSQLYEPIPFRTALADGCTHVVVLRTRPDGANVVGRPKLAERLIVRRFFKRKNKLPGAYYYMKRGGHKLLYARDVLTLNQGARAAPRDVGPHLLPISLKPGEAEIARLERRREGILEGVRKGFEHGHDILKRVVPGDALAGLAGREAAVQVFPESILDAEEDPIMAELGLSSLGASDGSGD